MATKPLYPASDIWLCQPSTPQLWSRNQMEPRPQGSNDQRWAWPWPQAYWQEAHSLESCSRQTCCAYPNLQALTLVCEGPQCRGNYHGQLEQNHPDPKSEDKTRQPPQSLPSTLLHHRPHLPSRVPKWSLQGTGGEGTRGEKARSASDTRFPTAPGRVFSSCNPDSPSTSLGSFTTLKFTIHSFRPSACVNVPRFLL